MPPRVNKVQAMNSRVTVPPAPVKLKFNDRNVNISNGELLQILRNKYEETLTQAQLESFGNYINNQFRRGDKTLKRFISNLINKGPPPGDYKKLINDAKAKINVKHISRKKIKNVNQTNTKNLIIELKKLGFKIDGRQLRENPYNQILDLIKRVRPQISQNNLNEIQLYKVLERVKNGLVQEHITRYKNELNGMSQQQLLKQLSKEFKLDNRYANYTNLTNINQLNRFKKLLIEKLEDIYKYYEKNKEAKVNQGLRVNNITNPVPGFRNYINIDPDAGRVIKKFFELYLKFLKNYLIDKSFYGYPPLKSSILEARGLLPTTKNITPNKKAFNSKGKFVINNYNSNANNNTPSSFANLMMREISTNRFKKLTQSNNAYYTNNNISTGNLTESTWVAFVILMWMDMRHDFTNKEVPKNFFDIFKSQNAHFVSILFPQIKNNNGPVWTRTRNGRVEFIKSHMDHEVINKLIRMEILKYEPNKTCLTVVSKFEDKIKNKLEDLLNIPGTLHTVSTPTQIRILSNPNTIISVDAEHKSKLTFSKITHTKYLPIERIFDPGIAYSTNDSLVNLMRHLISPSERNTIVDFNLRTYTLKFNGFRDVKIKLSINEQYKPVVSVMNSKLPVKISKNKAASNGTPEALLGKTFGDFLQILSLAGRRDSDKRIYFGTFDAMSGFIYAFTRKYIFERRNINLLLEIPVGIIAAYN